MMLDTSTVQLVGMHRPRPSPRIVEQDEDCEGQGARYSADSVDRVDVVSVRFGQRRCEHARQW